MPIGWETHSTPTMGDRPQAIINKQVLEGCDLLVGMFWTRIGTATGKAASGTIEEIEEHLAAGKPAMLYFSSAPVVPDSLDPDQYAALRKFKESLRDKGLYQSYDSAEDFRTKLSTQLTRKVIEIFPTESWSELDDQDGEGAPEIPPLNDLAKQMLVEGSNDKNGMIMRWVDSGGKGISANGKSFTERRNARSEAAGEAALRQLEEHGLVEAASYKREAFDVTEEGYRVADMIKATADGGPSS